MVDLTEAGRWAYDFVKEDPFGQGRTPKKLIDYYEMARDLLDQDNRTSALIQHGWKIAGKLAESAIEKALGEASVAGFGASVYFTYHEEHFKLLGDAVAALQKSKAATAAFAHAVQLANATPGVDKMVNAWRKQVEPLGFQYLGFGVAFGYLVERRKGALPPKAYEEMENLAITEKDLQAAGNEFRRYRANWLGLFKEVLELAIMLRVEWRATDQLWKKYEEIVGKLRSSDKSIDRVVGGATEKARQEEWALEVARDPTSARARNMENPTLGVWNEIKRVERILNALAKVCSNLLDVDIEGTEKAQKDLSSTLK